MTPKPAPLVVAHGHVLKMVAAVEQFKRDGTVPK